MKLQIMDCTKLTKKYLSIFLLPSFLSLVSASSQNPLEIIRSSNQQVQALLSQHEIIDPETETKLFEIIEGVTDFAAISEGTTHPFCKNLTEAQCAEFDQTFQEPIRISSIKKLGRYRADRFEYLGEDIDKDTAIVKILAFYEDDEVHLDYHLIHDGEKWLIVNYVVDDVDTIRNYKKQFLRLFARNTFDEIMERLEKKIQEYEREYFEPEKPPSG
ncbi:MAG: ABC transporter substrate-binding protein [Candidatus Aminicenantes bacterium]|jgi:ABC-type transporter MlaC component